VVVTEEITAVVVITEAEITEAVEKEEVAEITEVVALVEEDNNN
jgi:hypothetical protein